MQLYWCPLLGARLVQHGGMPLSAAGGGGCPSVQQGGSRTRSVFVTAYDVLQATMRRRTKHIYKSAALQRLPATALELPLLSAELQRACASCRGTRRLSVTSRATCVHLGL